MYRVAAIALGLLSSAAGAAPVYLKCQLDYDSSSSKSQTHELDLTLNEDAGTVTISFVGTSLTDTVRGVFNADKVTFKHDNLGYTADYNIDRTNLALRESILREADVSRIVAEGQTDAKAILAEMDRSRIINNGKCALVHVKRAF